MDLMRCVPRIWSSPLARSERSTKAWAMASLAFFVDIVSIVGRLALGVSQRLAVNGLTDLTTSTDTDSTLVAALVVKRLNKIPASGKSRRKEGRWRRWEACRRVEISAEAILSAF